MKANECDLEEAKHVALQKFLELATDPSKWSVWKRYDFSGYTTYFELGKFRASVCEHGEMGIFYVLRIGEELILSKSESISPKDEYPIPKPFAVYRDADTPFEDRVAEHEKRREEVRADPGVTAILSIKKYHEDVECEKQRQKILKDAQEACLKIQEALKEPLVKEEPEISKPRSPFWSRLFRSS